MDSVAPKQKTSRERIAQFVRMLGAPTDGEWENAWCALVRELHRERMNFSDIGNWIEQGEHDNGQYSEAELVEFGQAERAAGVEEGIKIGQARANGGRSNGHFMALPKPAVMAAHCYQRLAYLQTDKDRKFIAEMVARTQHGQGLTKRTLGYLASLYIGTGGKT